MVGDLFTYHYICLCICPIGVIEMKVFYLYFIGIDSLEFDMLLY